MDFEVSVIIPVFNAQRFISKAIHSCICLQEVKEVLVIDDGSSDSSRVVIEKLMLGSDKIKLLNHNNRVNKGRAESRNLGIEHASCNYIAFLDADDYYLSNRFEQDKIIFTSRNNVGGVYNAIGAHFYRDYSLEEKNRLELLTISKPVAPYELFELLFYGGRGYFSIIGLTLSKNVLSCVNGFNSRLEVSEDTEFIYKLALSCSLLPGIDMIPVAMRGVHDKNVYNNTNMYKSHELLLLDELLVWCSNHNISLSVLDIILKRIWLIRFKHDRNMLVQCFIWCKTMMRNPRLLLSKLSVKYFPLIRKRKELFPFLYN